MGNDEIEKEIKKELQQTYDENAKDQNKMIYTISWAGVLLYQAFANHSEFVIISSILFSASIMLEFLSCMTWKSYVRSAFKVNQSLIKRYEFLGDYILLIRDITFLLAMCFFMLELIRLCIYGK